PGVWGDRGAGEGDRGAEAGRQDELGPGRPGEQEGEERRQPRYHERLLGPPCPGRHRAGWTRLYRTTVPRRPISLPISTRRRAGFAGPPMYHLRVSAPKTCR